MLSLQPLPPTDQSRIATLWHYQGDVVSFMTATASDPHEMLLWLAQPHIEPWLETIAAHFRTRRETSASDALTRSLADLNKVLDLDAGPTLRVRAVNSIIKLAHAIYRGTRLAPIHANLRTQLQQNADSDLATAKSSAIRRARPPGWPGGPRRVLSPPAVSAGVARHRRRSPPHHYKAAPPPHKQSPRRTPATLTYPQHSTPTPAPPLNLPLFPLPLPLPLLSPQSPSPTTKTPTTPSPPATGHPKTQPTTSCAKQLR